MTDKKLAWCWGLTIAFLVSVHLFLLPEIWQTFFACVASMVLIAVVVNRK